jgi:hypothetical protein
LFVVDDGLDFKTHTHKQKLAATINTTSVFEYVNTNKISKQKKIYKYNYYKFSIVNNYTSYSF